MWSLFDVVAGDVPSPPAGPASSNGGASDIVGLLALILFVGFFVVTGFLYLKKKRVERINALAAELDRPGTSDTRALPSTGEGPDAVPIPKAADLVAAERAALLKRAEADAAARAAARATVAAASGDDEAKALAEAATLKAKEAEAALAVAADQARTLRLALGRTRDGLMGRLKTAVGGKTIDAAVLEDIEAVLFSADIGARTAERMLQAVKDKLSNKQLASLDKVAETLKAEATKILDTVEVKPLAHGLTMGTGPHVVLVLGVNGAGKTTTIGKLAAQLKVSGRSVLMGAGDTFRAAAADQLEVWATRAGVPIVTGPDGGDPSSVLFDTVKKAVTDNVDIVLCDTAGRLHTKANLMEELKKVHRSLAKACPGAPHEVILVLDATVGQNAIAQAKQFGEAAPLTGIILTKLDGTAKGGVVLGIVDELKVPVRYIGVGEAIGDLRTFVPKDFVEALFSDTVGAPPVS
jgi:fused signal recognition particle receptor